MSVVGVVEPIFVDGQWVQATGAAAREIRNPSTLALEGCVPDCGAAEIDAAVKAARAAQHAWWRTPGVEKAKALRDVAARIRAMERELSETMTRETGKPLIESIDCIEWVAACFD